MNKKVTSVVLAVCMLLSCLAVGGFQATAVTTDDAVAAAADDSAGANNYGLASEVKDGNILHCFDWKYSDIKAELPNIAKAGFTTVQTSPVQTPDPLGQWYGLYLPREFNCTSGPLGSKGELQALCSEADNYGIKIICDVVANHLTGDHANIQNDLKDGQYWHQEFDVSDWNNRYQVTHGKIGMPDLNTEHSYVQNVVFNYLQSLKNIGVDGFRFDAAKHIGLPSEGDGFWSRIAQIGVYRYGEILDSPGGDANSVMNEYARYIGITDSDYSGAITGAIRDGKTVDSNGNWVNRGISAEKIVYWGESHDTYSNNPPPDEGGWTKYLDQNIIDRAYAVVGAKANSQALYLSRPFQKDKMSIMSGQKGSTHFTSAEIAAVNHFHNAMVGKKEYYTTGNNCFVVCREGGAVIVAAKGSNFDVTVPNGGGIVAQGSYKDEVAGGTWNVNGSSISGHIGSSGIAVIYSAKPAGPSASVTPGSSRFNTDSITLTLNYDNATSGQYSIDGGAFQSFTNGQKITIGADKPYGSQITVTVKASGTGGTSDPETYTYKKIEFKQQMAYFDNSAYNWSNVYAYIYAGETANNGKWPGVAMQKDSTGYYAIQVPDELADGNIIFTESETAVDHRYPADMEPGLPLNGETMILKANHSWQVFDTPIPTQQPTQPTQAPTDPPAGNVLLGDTSGDNKVTITDATWVQMHAASMTSLSGDRLTAGDVNKNGSVDVTDATLIQLWLVYVRESGNYTGTWTGGGTYVEPTTAHVEPVTDEPEGNFVYYKDSNGWGSVNAYFWNQGGEMQWPGSAMESAGNGVFRIEIPSGMTHVIFSNANNSSAKTPDLDLPGVGYIYQNGGWSKYGSGGDTPVPAGNYIYYRDSNGWGSVNAYFWNQGGEMQWPGNAMQSAGSGIFRIEIPSGMTHVIFSNANNSSEKTPDLDLPGAGQIYENGNWTGYSG